MAPWLTFHWAKNDGRSSLSSVGWGCTTSPRERQQLVLSNRVNDMPFQKNKCSHPAQITGAVWPGSQVQGCFSNNQWYVAKLFVGERGIKGLMLHMEAGTCTNVQR